MTTRCNHCDYEFHNLLLRKDCPNCGKLLKEPKAAAQAEEKRKEDDDPDVMGFAMGYTTGIPFSPTHGISAASIIGAALHSNPSHAEEAPKSEPASFVGGGGDSGGSGASVSYDSGSSGGSDSGSSGGGDSGGGGGGGGGSD